mgnify:CR=1 FL=1
MDQSFVLELLNQPAVQAILVKAAGDTIQGYLKGVDKNHTLDPYKGPISVAITILTAITAYLTLALNHNLGSVDVKAVIEFILLYYNAHFVSKGVAVATAKQDSK